MKTQPAALQQTLARPVCLTQQEAARLYSDRLVYEDGLVHATPEAKALEDELRQKHSHVWVRHAMQAGKREAIARAMETLSR